MLKKHVSLHVVLRATHGPTRGLARQIHRPAHRVQASWASLQGPRPGRAETLEKMVGRL